MELSGDFRAVLSGGVRLLAEERSAKRVLVSLSRAGGAAPALAIAES